jgi:hypothetical protein
MTATTHVLDCSADPAGIRFRATLNAWAGSRQATTAFISGANHFEGSDLTHASNVGAAVGHEVSSGGCQQALVKLARLQDELICSVAS